MTAGSPPAGDGGPRPATPDGPADAGAGADVPRTTRRGLYAVAAVAAAGAGALFARNRPEAPAPAAQTAPGDAAFLGLSRLATGHRSLDGELAARLRSALASHESGFLPRAARLAAFARERGLTDVEALDAALAASTDGAEMRGALRTLLSAWYTGAVGDAVVAYPDALMYRVVGDGMVVPTLPTGGPDYWTAEPPRLGDMPEF